MGIKHHALFDEVIEQIQSGAEVEVLKGQIRQGRVALGDWLFARFKDISLLESPNSPAAVEVFEHYLEAISKQCEAVVQGELFLIHHEALFKADADDSTLRGGIKSLKRFMRSKLGISLDESSFLLYSRKIT